LSRPGFQEADIAGNEVDMSRRRKPDLGELNLAWEGR
jgi:hypothetical protein